jgi:hypothetical protein
VYLQLSECLSLERSNIDGVGKEKSKPKIKETKTYVQQVEDTINILNFAFKDFSLIRKF